MGKINEKKLEAYANKLYRGELARYKKKLEKDDIYSITTFYRDEGKIKRKSISKSQEKDVIDKHKNKCVICSKPYDRDDFEIHHINGDRGNPLTGNLVPLCHRCHKKIKTKAKAKLKDYKVRQGGKKQKPNWGLPEIEPIEIDMPKPPKYN